MMHFKHLKSGMSFLEVMGAIAILAIFGSSLFLLQQYFFERMIIAQTQLTAQFRLQQDLVAYQKNIVKEQLEHDGYVEKSLDVYVKTYVHPDMTITITTQSNIASKSEQASMDNDTTQSHFKMFKNLHIITARAEQDQKNLAQAYTFLYAPKVEKK